MLSRLIWVKHHCRWLWAIIEKINNFLLVVLWHRRISVVRHRLTTPQPFVGGIIRLLNKDDTDLLVEFLKQVTKEELLFFSPHGFDRNSIKFVLSSPGYLPIGFFVGDRMAGYFLMRLLCTRKAFIGRYLSSEFRMKGLGGKMGMVLYDIGRDLNFDVYSTISKDNLSSLKSHEAMGRMVIVKDMPNNYVLVKFNKK